MVTPSVTSSVPRATEQNGSGSPRRSPSSSRSGTTSPVIMTPGQKVRALLAQFDSDSEGEDGGTKKPVERKLFNGAAGTERPAVNGRTAEGNASHEQGAAKESNSNAAANTSGVEDDDDEEVDVVFRPRGRLAARMMAPEENIAEEREETTPRPKRSDRVEDGSPMDAESGDHTFEREEREDSPLFVPEGSPVPDAANGEGETNGTDPRSRLFELVRRKRLEQEQADPSRGVDDSEGGVEDEGAENEDSAMPDDTAEADASDEEDRAAEQRLATQSKPTRKASKKAILEMNRETQRMSRNMQLTHQAITKKKITLDSFLSRFNRSVVVDEPSQSAQDQTSSLPDSESNNAGIRDTPPTSPPKVADPVPEGGAEVAADVAHREAQTSVESAGQEETITQPPTDAPEPSAANQRDATPQPQDNSVAAPKPSKSQVRLQLSKKQIAENQLLDMDDDLEIVTDPAKARRIAIFENRPTRKQQQGLDMSTSLQHLRALAQLSSSPPRGESHNDSRVVLTRKQLEADLWRRAREQAAKERADRIEALRAKGIMIEAPEDRFKVEEEVEDLVEKARAEAESIRKAERDKKKKNDEEGGEDDGEYVDDENSEEEDDEDEEEDEVGEDENQTADGNDDEEMDLDDDEDEGAEALRDQPVEQPDNGNKNNEAQEADDLEVDQPPSTELRSRRARRAARIVPDDDDDINEVEDKPESGATKQPMPQIESTAQEPEIPNLGLPKQGESIMSLSQAFMGTLVNSQPDTPDGQEQDKLEMLRKMPESAESLFDTPDLAINHSESPVQATQKAHEPEVEGRQRRPSISSLRFESPAGKSMTSLTQMPTPTQDMGFTYSPFDPAKRFMRGPSSTAEAQSPGSADTSNVHRVRRLIRGASKPNTRNEDGEKGSSTNSDAFAMMRRAMKQKKTKQAFIRDKSNAKEIVDEVAEESDDEYAGLGGRSDDSEGEEDEFDRQMIDDDAEDIDEEAHAALNAEHLRRKDEADVTKLFHDITSGNLRRKRGRGDDLDLDESDDERRSARRREKRREFAKMRRALLAADEKIGQIAEDPKKTAFLKTLEDHDDDDTDLFGNDAEWGGSGNDESSQSAVPTASAVNSDAEAAGTERNGGQGPAGSSRRPKASSKKHDYYDAQKPRTINEIKSALSSLLDDPEEASQSSVDQQMEEVEEEESEDELEVEMDETDAATPDAADAVRETPREESPAPSSTRTQNLRQRAYVDRLSLRKAAFVNATTASASKVAFNKDKRAPNFNRALSVGRTSSSRILPSSQNHESAGGKPEQAASAGGRRSTVNFYAASRQRQREAELRQNVAALGSNKKVIAATTAARRGGGLRSWLGNDGFES